MPAGYGNHNDNDGNDKDVDSTDFTTTWKIYLILFFKVGVRAEEWRQRAEGWGPKSRAKDRGKPRPVARK